MRLYKEQMPEKTRKNVDYLLYLNVTHLAVNCITFSVKEPFNFYHNHLEDGVKM